MFNFICYALLPHFVIIYIYIYIYIYIHDKTYFYIYCGFWQVCSMCVCVFYYRFRVFFSQRTGHVHIEVSSRIGSGLQRNCAVRGTHSHIRIRNMGCQDATRWAPTLGKKVRRVITTRNGLKING